MIMILSDGGEGVKVAEKQLELHGDKYCVYFSDVISASRYANGNVLIGPATRHNMAKVYAENSIDAVLDVTEMPNSKLSYAALSACNEKIKYAKLVKCGFVEGAKLCLKYKEIAEIIKKCNGNVLMCANPDTVNAISRISEALTEKMYVVLSKDVVFDMDRALEYNIPLLNVMEIDEFADNSIASAIEKTDAKMVVFAWNTENLTQKVKSAVELNVEAVVTHSLGIDYPAVYADVRDAVIYLHS